MRAENRTHFSSSRSDVARAALTSHGNHVRLTVRLTPNGGRDAIDGFETAADGEEHLKVRVRGVPEKGKANEALIAALAKALGLAKNKVSLVSGDTQRKKILRIEADPEAIAKRLADIAGTTE
ncbi:DUF167 family protein [Ensifer aridi]|uniref:DUF167 family protein n=1 Tax=Ensifer aridi TaxID=1708715 RepID=UPI000A0FC5C9|nr:DUF167 family protein [Ensifer aridi]